MSEGGGMEVQGHRRENGACCWHSSLLGIDTTLAWVLRHLITVLVHVDVSAGMSRGRAEEAFSVVSGLGTVVIPCKSSFLLGCPYPTPQLQRVSFSWAVFFA